MRLVLAPIATPSAPIAIAPQTPSPPRQTYSAATGLRSSPK